MKMIVNTDDVVSMTGDSQDPTKLLISLSGGHGNLECEFDFDRDKAMFVKILKVVANNDEAHAKRQQRHSSTDSGQQHSQRYGGSLSATLPLRLVNGVETGVVQKGVGRTRSGPSPARVSEERQRQRSLSQTSSCQSVHSSTAATSSEGQAGDIEELLDSLHSAMRRSFAECSLKFGLLKNVSGKWVRRVDRLWRLQSLQPGHSTGIPLVL
jgi:hypothetical protein